LQIHGAAHGQAALHPWGRRLMSCWIVSRSQARPGSDPVELWGQSEGRKLFAPKERNAELGGLGVVEGRLHPDVRTKANPADRALVARPGNCLPDFRLGL